MDGEVPHCGDCGKVIGVYEPLIDLDGGRPRETSRAQEQHGREWGRCYHRECWLLRDDRLEGLG